VGAGNFEEARSALSHDGAILVVLTECHLPRSTQDKSIVSGKDIFSAFDAQRHEVSIFIYTEESDCHAIVSGGFVAGYFFKGEKDFDDVAQKVQSEVATTKSKAPFFEALVEYTKLSKDIWHTPGHAGGQSLKGSPFMQDYYSFFGENLFQSDLSVSVPQLDSLLDPKGVIKQAQELAAHAFGARHTFFSTNGTSTANKVLIQTLVKPGECVLLDRNCHKSVHYGVVISGAEPIYLMPSVNHKYGIFGPVPKSRILEAMDGAISEGKTVKAIILTNCTYDGLIYDLRAIVDQAHARGVKVIVDEAWFGHANFHPDFYPCAMAAGADYSTQSTHKTMSAFSQASMIHVADPEFEANKEFFQENFNMHSSTSPQYPMIASLDAARKQMAMEGYTLLQSALSIADKLKASINVMEKFKVLELRDLLGEEVKTDGVRLDRTKLTIDVSRSGFTSREIEQILLSKHHIQIEKSTFNTITLLITIGATTSKANRLLLALQSIEDGSGGRPDGGSPKTLRDFKLSLSPIKITPRLAYYAEGEMVPLKDSTGRIATTMVVPYPPGIPLLVPGQLITDEIVSAFMTYRDFGVEIHGLSDGMLKVVSRAGEAKWLADRRK
jgi:arginine/lysine/ornithine decarboxylase